MRALILAAGEGTRLRPLTLDRPKPMLSVGGKPLLEHLVDLLASHAVRQIAINLHYRPEAIVRHFGDGCAFGVELTYSEEPELLGSAGAAKHLEWYFHETFLVLYGDLLTDVDLTALLQRHWTSRAVATIALYEVEDPTRAGIVDVDGTGRVTRFVEKPARHEVFGNLANAGIYVLEPSVLDYVPTGRPFDFGHDLFPILLALGLPLYGSRASGYVLDIGSPARYAQAIEDFAAGRVRGVGCWRLGVGGRGHNPQHPTPNTQHLAPSTQHPEPGT